jgi:hypothetical protein
MFLFAHAMAGILIGLVLAVLTGDRRVVALATLGALLPDLIDKPLGHIILAGTVNYGRLYFHSLTLLLLITSLGLLLYHYRHQIGLLAVAAGMASHHVLDGMWQNPVTWFWPFLGPIPGRHYPENYFWVSLWQGLTQPSEWIFFFLTAGLLVILYRREFRTILGRIASPRGRRVIFAALGLAILATLAALAITRHLAF